MDTKVYKKETIKQPQGDMEVYVPSVIDFFPVFKEDNDIEYLDNLELLEQEIDILEQASALATIWQRGLDPLDLESGNRWSELFLGEISVLQIMEDLTNSVSDVSNNVEITFDTITDAQGNSFLTYNLKVVL
jgi:hypothetical protein